ncbi:MAG TPA: phosphoenolpyruvate--protein phosphotransferase [Candidatus Cloacimonadota bacterium]|nr:phosphoenolpyruvate--protein phosphotransferase [Candidatus Cloacimonadota bacterium]
MKILKGLAVSEGIAIGKARIIEREKHKIERKLIEKSEVTKELERFNGDVKAALAEIDSLIDNYAASQEHKDILTTQKMILQDPEFVNRVGKQIRNELCSVEHAVSNYFTEVAGIFHKMNNDFYAQRVSDYEDVAYRLLSHTLKQRRSNLADLDENSVLFMENITPSFVTRVFAKRIQGLATVQGARNSHSSIIARSMQLPMLVGIPDLLREVKEGDQVILDGFSGDMLIDPTEEELQKYRKIYEQEKSYQSKLQKLIDLKAVTADGKKIKLLSNIEIPDELDQVVRLKSEGIGLFRTEFLFIDKNDLPDENEQYEIYQKIAAKIYPETVIIRTIDVGGDKLSSILNLRKETNPNLGCRGIRISFQNIAIFQQQIRAILRANQGNISIMFPMISDVDEVIKAKEIIAECCRELQSQKVECNENIRIGAMIEVPSAVITSDAIARECDFLSIGTNDLVQYTLAVDRDNEGVAQYYKTCHPSVLRSIKMTVENAHKAGIPVAVCGEMASNLKYVKLLIGLGVDELSVSPGRLLRVKDKILQTDYIAARKMIEKVLLESSSEQIKAIIRKDNEENI